MTKHVPIAALASVLLASLAAAHAGDPSVRRTVSFARNDGGWTPHFADLPAGEEGNYELNAQWGPLPRGAGGPRRRGWVLSGNNHSDDLWMGLAGRVEGLVPGHAYEARFRVTFVSRAPRGSVGVGGSPGESVYVKAGAATAPPQVLDDGEGFRVLNLDKGNQSEGGANAHVLGDVSVKTSVRKPKWKRKTLRTAGTGTTVVADDAGGAWVLVGTDSGFEGVTEIGWTAVRVDFVARD